MAEKLKPYIPELVKRWQERLEVRHWDIDLDILHDEHSYGTCSIIDGRFNAKIRIDNETDFENTRMAVVHELVHIVISGQYQAVERLEESGVFTAQGWQVFRQQWSHQMEFDVDHLTRLFLAMPHWKDDDLDPDKQTAKRGRR